jgi:hypothetical protein
MGKRERERGGETQETFGITRLKKNWQKYKRTFFNKRKVEKYNTSFFLFWQILLESTQAKGEYTLDPTPHRRKSILVTIKIQNVQKVIIW